MSNYLIFDKDFITYIVIWYNHNSFIEIKNLRWSWPLNLSIYCCQSASGNRQTIVFWLQYILAPQHGHHRHIQIMWRHYIPCIALTLITNWWQPRQEKIKKKHTKTNLKSNKMDVVKNAKKDKWRSINLNQKPYFTCCNSVYTSGLAILYLTHSK